jgi:hypothetical protein
MMPDDGHGSEEEGGPEDRAGSSRRRRRCAAVKVFARCDARCDVRFGPIRVSEAGAERAGLFCVGLSGTRRARLHGVPTTLGSPVGSPSIGFFPYQVGLEQ